MEFKVLEDLVELANEMDKNNIHATFMIHGVPEEEIPKELFPNIDRSNGNNYSDEHGRVVVWPAKVKTEGFSWRSWIPKRIREAIEPSIPVEKSEESATV